MKSGISDTYEKSKKRSIAEQAGYNLAFAVIGFLLAGTSVKGVIYPFGGALVSACRRDCVLSAATGVLVRSITMYDYTIGAKYMAIVAIIATVRFMIPKSVQGSKAGDIIGISVSAGGYLVVNAIELIIDFASFRVAMISLAEVLLAAGSAYFLRYALAILTRRGHTDSINTKEATSLIISFVIVLMSLSSYEIARLSPARIGAIAVVLLFARYGRSSTSATIGIASGVALSLGTSQISYLSGGYALGGLLSGIFSPLGSFATAFAFLTADLTVAVMSDISFDVLVTLYEGLIASAVFMAIPSGAGQAFVDFFEPKRLVRTDNFKRGTLMRLDFAGVALCDVSDTVEKVAAKLRRSAMPSKSAITGGVYEKLCLDCEKRESCFGENKENREKDFKTIETTLREHGRLEKSQLPADFSKDCIQSDRFVSLADAEYSEVILKQSAEARIEEFRSIVVGQFKNLSSMLFEMSSSISQSQRADFSSEQKIYAQLRDLRLIPTDISANIGRFDKMTVELRLKDNGRDVKNLKLPEKVSQVCGRDFDGMSITTSGDDMLISLCEKSDLCCDFAVTQHNCNGARLCGDSYKYFEDGRGHAIMILSDGMGNGGRAAVDGAMASGLMMRLIKAGLGFESALSIVNSAMLYKSEDESLATVDMCCVDLYSGKCDFYKAGAAKSIILQRGKAIFVENNSLPIGILKDISFEKQTEKLYPGAVVLMMSDGAVDVMGDWIDKELRKFDGEDIRTLVKAIATKAKILRKMYRDDDITVMAMRLQKRG